MLPQLCFFVSIAFSFIAWGIATARYIWPELRLRQREEALRPLLILHSFRFIGLAFLVPGVVSPDLPSAFAHSAAYGDLISATLAPIKGDADLSKLRAAAENAPAFNYGDWRGLERRGIRIFRLSDLGAEAVSRADFTRDL